MSRYACSPCSHRCSPLSPRTLVPDTLTHIHTHTHLFSPRSQVPPLSFPQLDATNSAPKGKGITSSSPSVNPATLAPPNPPLNPLPSLSTPSTRPHNACGAEAPSKASSSSRKQPGSEQSGLQNVSAAWGSGGPLERSEEETYDLNPHDVSTLARGGGAWNGLEACVRSSTTGTSKGSVYVHKSMQPQQCSSNNKEVEAGAGT
jgi:hypothetical protein